MRGTPWGEELRRDRYRGPRPATRNAGPGMTPRARRSGFPLGKALGGYEQGDWLMAPTQAGAVEPLGMESQVSTAAEPAVDDRQLLLPLKLKLWFRLST